MISNVLRFLSPVMSRGKSAVSSWNVAGVKEGATAWDDVSFISPMSMVSLVSRGIVFPEPYA